MRSPKKGITDSICKGCNLYEVCYKGFTFKGNNKYCPCSKCLIKMMCKEACDEYSYFRKTYTLDKG